MSATPLEAPLELPYKRTPRNTANLVRPTLTQSQVDKARQLYDKGRGVPVNRLAKEYGVSSKTMYNYLNDPTKKGRPDDERTPISNTI